MPPPPKGSVAQGIEQQQALEHEFLGASPRPIPEACLSKHKEKGAELPVEAGDGHAGDSPQTHQLHDAQGTLDRAHASGLRGSHNLTTTFGASPLRMLGLSLFMCCPLLGSCPALILRFWLLFAQAERDGVAKWLIWAQADPQKRSGNAAKLPQDSGRMGVGR